MKVSHIKISNILGIEALEFSPGGFTEISGANGSGKTSVLEAVRSALRGGSDATLLRNGADKGEIVLLLDDGTEIKKRVNAAGKSTVSVERGGAVLKSPAAVIAQLADMLSVNPVEFLRASDKDRVQVLLQTMPIEVDPGVIEQIAGSRLPVSPGYRGLDLLEYVRKAVYDDRTGVNRALKEKEATIAQLRATLPDAPPEEPPTDASLLEQLAELDRARDAEAQRIVGKLAKLKADSDERISNLQEQIAAERDSFAAVSARASEADQEMRADHRIARSGIEAQLAQADQAKAQYARHQQTAETVARLAVELGQLKDEHEASTSALLNLDAYKEQLLGALPIPGLEIREGQVFRAGVAFDRLNTAQQVEIAFEIAKLRAGQLGLICVDGLELLDTAAYEAFRAHAEASDLQLIVSRVSDGALAVQAA